MTQNKTEQPEINQSTTIKKKLTAKQISLLSITIIILIAFVAFIVQNWNRVGVEFLFWKLQIRIIFLIILSFIAGGLTVYTSMKYKKKKKQL